MTDILLWGILVVLTCGVMLTRHWLRELHATLNALAEMLGEDIDRRNQHGKTD